MIEKYTPPTEPGESYIRCFKGAFLHPKDGVTTMTFQEEEAVLRADGSWATHSTGGAVSTSYIEGEEIALYNPLNDQIVGVITHEEILAAIYSLARAAQIKRDAVLAAREGAQR